jgi:hypothetical protein
MRTRLRSESGFSLPEMLIAAAIMVTVIGGVFTVMNPAQGTYRTQPEVTDLQQRLRIASDMLGKDIVMAGGGVYAGGMTGALSNYFAPVMPHRLNDPSEGVYFRLAQGATDASDSISFFYVPSTGAQTTIREDMPQPSSELKVDPQANCPPAKTEQLCGFYDGLQAIILDETGAWDPITITQVQPAALHMQHKNPLSKSYQKGAVVAMAATRTYYLQTDVATNTFQLRLFDGGLSDLPVVDNINKLEFEYYGDPQAPVLLPNKSLTDPIGPWTTYGPKPPPLGVDNTKDTWAAGENCLYSVQGGQHVPRLTDLAGGVGQVRLTQAMLTDGPWCPDATSMWRYDADLLRLRRVRIKLRVQAPTELRGPAGTLFRHAGTSSAGQHYVPDQEVAFDITPRNLNLGR